MSNIGRLEIPLVEPPSIHGGGGAAGAADTADTGTGVWHGRGR